MKVICIYPIEEDNSTNFLMPIYEMLENLNSSSIEFTGYRPQKGDSIDEHIGEIVSLSEEDVIIFLGHGSSHNLQNNYNPLINSDNYFLFDNKRVFLLACYSKVFIQHNSDISLKESIGFGNMLTSWSEIMADRDNDVSAHRGITDEHINTFNSILTESVKNALYKTIQQNKSFDYLFAKIKIALNKAISNLLIEKKVVDYKRLVHLLYKTKREMTLHLA